MKKDKEIQQNPSTEELIKEAARRVFTEKGYAATRTRDIAEEAGINLALINYYFRSKEKLFDIIMVEQIQVFIPSLSHILDNKETSLYEKLEQLVSHYIDLLIANPGLPLFILNEINTDPEKLVKKIGLDQQKGRHLYIMQQLQEEAARRKTIPFNPIHLLMNFVALTIFPFIGGPMIRNRTGINMEQFNQLMQERKKLIPVWIQAILNIEPNNTDQ